MPKFYREYSNLTSCDFRDLHTPYNKCGNDKILLTKSHTVLKIEFKHVGTILKAQEALQN